MDVIRARGYHHWDGRLESRRFPWWPVTRTGIRLAFRKKWFKLFFAGGFLPPVVALGFIYASERLGDFSSLLRGNAKLITIDPKFFMSFLTNDGLLFMIVMVLVFAGAGLIADDLKHNSLQVYFSRPLGKKDYLLGKMAVVFFFVLVLTFVPAVFLFVFKLVFAGSFKFFLDYPWLLLSIAGYSGLLTVFFAFYTLLLSALSKDGRYVMILIFMAYFFSQVLSAILRNVFRTPYMVLFSVRENLKQVGALLFGQKPPHGVPVVWSFLVLAAVCGLSTWVLNRKIRAAEVIR